LYKFAELIFVGSNLRPKPIHVLVVTRALSEWRLKQPKALLPGATTQAQRFACTERACRLQTSERFDLVLNITEPAYAKTCVVAEHY